MMKISKPITLKDFSVSPVQFTSFDSVLFKNVKTIYDGNETIILEYEFDSKIGASSRDWIGIFPRGWNTLQQYVTFEWVSRSLPYYNTDQNKENHGEIIRKTITFSPKYHVNAVNSSMHYQFVYVSKQIEVLGVSSYFQFDLSNVNDGNLELECLVPISCKLRSTSLSDFGTLLTRNDSSSSSITNSAMNATTIRSLQNLNSDGKLNWTTITTTLPMNLDNNMDLLSKKPPLPSGTGDALDPYSSHSEPGFPMSLQMSQCKKCLQFKKGGHILAQQVLQSKLKIVMERNRILEQRALEMKKEMEKLQTESKRLKMSFYYLKKEKTVYEKFVKDLLKALEKDSFVRVMNGKTEILVKKVNYVGMEEHQRDKKTSKKERELKAVIGLQEITIRNLINSLHEKAKSVDELNQTVKLAERFSAATRDESRESSDAEESMDEVCSSGNNSEYEFSLTRPQPPEEISVDTDAVLDDIRRTTEMELRQIGINRTLNESSSKNLESELNVANLSVLGYDKRDEKIEVKRAKSAENIQCDWSLETHNEVSEPEPPVENESTPNENEIDPDVDNSVFEDYYDAYDAFSMRSGVNPVEEEVDEANNLVENEEKNEKPEEFLMTAIVPKNMDIKPSTPPTSIEENEEKISPVEKGKTFTCELSFDFAPRKSQPQESKPNVEESTVEPKSNEIVPISNNAEICTLKRENSLITFKKSDKCLEIEITQTDQKENPGKNCVHQKMVLKFGNNQAKLQEENSEKKKTSIELNLALTAGMGDKKEEKINEESSEEGLTTDRSDSSESKSTNREITTDDNYEEEGNTSEVEIASPRTVWNDAVDLSEDEKQETPRKEIEEATLPSEQVSPRSEKEETLPNLEEVTPRNEAELQSDENKSEILEESLDKCNEDMLSKDSINNLKLYQDSIRYEKNLEFLQNKIGDRCAEEENEKEKPSAILIQNGMTKVALIRYQ